MQGLHDAMEGARAARSMLDRIGWEWDAMSFCSNSTADQFDEACRTNLENDSQRMSYWHYLGSTLR